MFGFFVGALSAWGLVRLHRARHGGIECHGTAPRRWMLRRLFHRIEATPSQEKVLQQAFEEVEASARRARTSFPGAHERLAALFRNGTFDVAAFDAVLEGPQSGLDEVKKVLQTQLGLVHEALTPLQRERIAAWVERGPIHWRGSGGCANACHRREEAAP